MAVEASPAFLCRLAELEHHRQTRSTRAAAFCFSMPQSNCRERAFDGIGRAKVLPVLGREVVERQQHVAVLFQTFASRRELRTVLLQEVVEGLIGCLSGLELLLKVVFYRDEKRRRILLMDLFLQQPDRGKRIRHEQEYAIVAAISSG